jgi:hypothetical protein
MDRFSVTQAIQPKTNDGQSSACFNWGHARGHARRTQRRNQGIKQASEHGVSLAVISISALVATSEHDLEPSRLERMTGIEPALSAWEAGEPTSQVAFQAQIWPFEGTFGGLTGGLGARGGPEHLINLATANIADTYGMRPQPPRRWRHLCLKQRPGPSRQSRPSPNAHSPNGRNAPRRGDRTQVHPCTLQTDRGAWT